MFVLKCVLLSGCGGSITREYRTEKTTIVIGQPLDTANPNCCSLTLTSFLTCNAFCTERGLLCPRFLVSPGRNLSGMEYTLTKTSCGRYYHSILVYHRIVLAILSKVVVLMNVAEQEGPICSYKQSQQWTSVHEVSGALISCTCAVTTQKAKKGSPLNRCHRTNRMVRKISSTFCSCSHSPDKRASQFVAAPVCRSCKAQLLTVRQTERFGLLHLRESCVFFLAVLFLLLWNGRDSVWCHTVPCTNRD